MNTSIIHWPYSRIKIYIYISAIYTPFVIAQQKSLKIVRVSESDGNEQLLEQFYSLSPKKKYLVCTQEKQNKNHNRSKLSVIFNERYKMRSSPLE